MRNRMAVGVGCLVLLAVACGTSSSSDGGSADTGPCSTNGPTQFPDSEIACSCNGIATSGQCSDFGPAAYCTSYGTQVDAGKGCPSAANLTYSPSSACPTTNLVGTCYLVTNGPTRYYSPTYTTSSAQALCNSQQACFVAP